jgi:hypothetical protein
MVATVNGDDTTGHIEIGDITEAGVFHHSGKLVLSGVFADALGQVAVTVFITGDDLTQAGQNAERVGVVDLFQTLEFNF